MTPVRSQQGRGLDLVVAIVGPTASGKTELSLDVAEQLGGEIVNADAFQLYRGMDIGTAKVATEERRNIPHHQLDVLDVTEEASVAAYQECARADIDAILARQRVPVLVGGSGLYVRAVLDDLRIPPTDPRVRARLESELQVMGNDEMRRRLQRLDPAAADTIDPRNTRRIIRALEVVELTGRPFAANLPSRVFVRPTLLVAPDLPRNVLDARIARRTEAMWQRGLVEEVRSLLARGLAGSPTASRAVGYRQCMSHIAGHLSDEEAITRTTTATRRLVRRQLSWFGADPRVRWLPSPDETGLGGMAGRVVEMVTDLRRGTIDP